MTSRRTTNGFWTGLRAAGLLALAVAAASALWAAPAAAADQFTTSFRIESCTWSAWGRQNPYFNLRPGFQQVLEGEDDGAEARVEITVLPDLEVIQFTSPRGVPITVVARVVEEREFEDGELSEVSRNWFARCVETNDVFYFGEEVDLFEDGELVGTEGAWRAGEDGAQPGLIMPGTFLLGARYFQEQAPGVAEDRGENTRMGLRATVPAGTFLGCVEVEETNALEPGDKGLKVYCPGVGIVMDEDLELVDFGVGIV